MTRAATSISTSGVSRWEFEVAGIHAAAACSMAPRTYPFVTVRRSLSPRPHHKLQVSCRRWLIRGRVFLRRRRCDLGVEFSQEE